MLIGLKNLLLFSSFKVKQRNSIAAFDGYVELRRGVTNEDLLLL